MCMGLSPPAAAGKKILVQKKPELIRLMKQKMPQSLESILYMNWSIFGLQNDGSVMAQACPADFSC